MFKSLLTRKMPLLGFMTALFWSGFVSAQVTLPRAASPAAEVSQTIGISRVTINYSRPSVKDREIWGALVPYGYNNLGFGTATAAPWRAGANENTTITFSHDAQVEGNVIPAGTYGLFVAPKEDGSADVIFSKNSTSWGSFFYSKDEDQLRVTVQTEEIPHTERLTYDFVNIDNTSATAVLDWEKKRFPFKVSFDVHEIVLANAKNELRSTQGFTWLGPYSAANYSLQNDVELEQGLAWAEQSISAQKNFNNLSVKSQLLTKLGRVDEADQIMHEAINMPSANAFQIHAYGRQLIARGEIDKALEIFEFNYEKNNGAWPTNYGLARGYSAKGDFKKAIKYLKVAQTNVPPNDTINPPIIETNLRKLEKGEDIN